MTKEYSESIEETPTAKLALRQAHALTQLLDVYGISRDNENCWFKLSRDLAEKYVPGFPKQSHIGGARKKHTVDYHFCVLAYAEYKRRIQGIKSDMEACRQLVHSECFKPELRGTHEELAETLRGQLRTARKDIDVTDAVNRMEIDWNNREDVYRAFNIAYSNRVATHGCDSPLP